MFNFELIIRERTDFERQSESFGIVKVEISGIRLITSNPVESEYEFPWVNRGYARFWIGNFVPNAGEVDVVGVMLVKVRNFPRYPVLQKPSKLSKNRITITKIHKSNGYERVQIPKHGHTE